MEGLFTFALLLRKSIVMGQADSFQEEERQQQFLFNRKIKLYI